MEITRLRQALNWDHLYTYMGEIMIWYTVYDLRIFMGVPGILYPWFMPHGKAMEQRVEEEKNQNRLLLDRLAHLEKQMVESQAKDKTPESVPPSAPSSTVEDLLAQAMTQIQSLEKKLDEQSRPKPGPASKVDDGKKKHREAHPQVLQSRVMMGKMSLMLNHPMMSSLSPLVAGKFLKLSFADQRFAVQHTLVY